MAAPTEDEIQGQINDAILLLEEADQFLRTNTPNVSSMYDQLVDGLKGEYAPLAIDGADAYRSRAAGLVDDSVGRAMVDQFIREYGRLKAYPDSDPQSIFNRLIDYFGAGSERVTTRTFTFNAASLAGGNTGTGAINRLTKDRYGFDIEAATPEIKTFTCVQDRFSGSQIHQELFEVRGIEFQRDLVGGYVSPDRLTGIRSWSADDSERIIANPSFNRYSGTAPNVTAITSWTETTSINNFQIETADSYRTAVHEGTTPGSVRFEGVDTLTQALSVARPTLVAGTPYYCQVAFKREASCDGTLTLNVGSNSKAVVLSAQSGWTILRLDLDANLYFENFNQTNLSVSLALSGWTTGTLLVDDFQFYPMTRFDGTFWAIAGGVTPWLVDDSATVTDSATDSILQKWLWRLGYGYLAHATTASGNVTWAEPS